METAVGYGLHDVLAQNQMPHVGSGYQDTLFPGQSDDPANIVKPFDLLVNAAANGTILVDIDGKKVGQVNGLSVMEIGGYAFGRPSRVTASVGMGQAGIINIERESHLSGSIHDKGVLILAGYLRNRFGQKQPLALSASLCFEQSYGGT